MPSHIATYQLDDASTVSFEIGDTDAFRPASPDQVVGRVRDAIGPAVRAAKEVLDKVKDLGPAEVEVAFGVKVSGGAQWLVAKATGEASFEITLKWAPKAERHAVAPDLMISADMSELATNEHDADSAEEVESTME